MIKKEISREDLSNWANNYIRSEDTIEMDSLDDWDLLVTICMADLLVSPNEYLFSIDDIKDWIK